LLDPLPTFWRSSPRNLSPFLEQGEDLASYEPAPPTPRHISSNSSGLKKFYFDFGEAVVAPSLSYDFKCPGCGNINSLSFKVMEKTSEDLPVVWASGNGVIVRSAGSAKGK
jgi:hypothetical protein